MSDSTDTARMPCPCRGSNEMCGCQNGPHPVRQDPEEEITALRARLAIVEADLQFMTECRNKWQDAATVRAAAPATADETEQDARIPDHAAWAARGRWREAYEALRALADEART